MAISHLKQLRYYFGKHEKMSTVWYMHILDIHHVFVKVYLLHEMSKKSASCLVFSTSTHHYTIHKKLSAISKPQQLHTEISSIATWHMKISFFSFFNNSKV